MKARVIKVEHSVFKGGEECSFIWAIVEGCELPGKIFTKGHVNYTKGSEISITVEPNYKGMLVVKVVQ